MKEFVRDNLTQICIPRAGDKEVIGTITHVSSSCIITLNVLFQSIDIHFVKLGGKLFEILVSTTKRKTNC